MLLPDLQTGHSPSQERGSIRASAVDRAADAALPIVLLLGIVLRLVQYLQNRSLWVDEAMLAINFTGKSFSKLVTSPLQYNQQAPIGFLIVEKVLVDAFGNGEYVLRLFPLICGIAALLLFPRVARRALPSTLSQLVAVTLFATSFRLIFYASDVKQYSGDVAAVVILSLAAFRTIEAEFRPRRTAALGILGVIAIWFSHPAAFVLGGIAITMVWSLARQRAWAKFPVMVLAAADWGVSFISYYMISLQGVTRNGPLLSYWAGSFMPLPPRSLSDLRWFDETF